MNRTTDGVISAGELYTLRQFKARLQLGVAAWKGMRQRGFPFIRIGKRVYVSGRQAIEFLERQVDGCAGSVDA